MLSISIRKRVLLGIKVLAYVLVHLFLAWIVFNPFNDLEMVVMKSFVAIMAGLFITYTVIKWREYFELLSIVILVNVLIVMGIHYPFYSHFKNLPAPDPSAMSIMQRVQQGAVTCMNIGKNLYTINNSKPYSTQDGHPSIGFKLCDETLQTWEELPYGWKYNKVEDPDTHDNNFLFSSQSFTKDVIVCNQVNCTLIKEE